MCGLTAIGLALGAAQSVAGFAQQQQQYKAQKRAAAQQQELLRRQAINRYDEIALQRQKERAAASRQLRKSQSDGLRARERVRTRAGEAGSAGLSLQGLLRSIDGERARFDEGIREANLFQNQQLELAKQGQELQTSLRLQSVREPTPPDLLGAASTTFSRLGRLAQAL